MGLSTRMQRSSAQGVAVTIWDSSWAWFLWLEPSKSEMCEAIICVRLAIFTPHKYARNVNRIILSLGATCRVLCNDNHEVRIKYLLVQEIFTWLIIWWMLTASLRFLVFGLLVKWSATIAWMVHQNLGQDFVCNFMTNQCGEGPTLLVLTWCVSRQLSTFLSLLWSLLLWCYFEWLNSNLS